MSAHAARATTSLKTLPADASEYALGQRGVTIPPRVAYAIVRALVPGGVPQLLTRHAARIIRGTSPTVRQGSSSENVTKRLSQPSKLSQNK